MWPGVLQSRPRFVLCLAMAAKLDFRKENLRGKSSTTDLLLAGFQQAKSKARVPTSSRAIVETFERQQRRCFGQNSCTKAQTYAVRVRAQEPDDESGESELEATMNETRRLLLLASLHRQTEQHDEERSALNNARETQVKSREAAIYIGRRLCGVYAGAGSDYAHARMTRLHRSELGRTKLR